MKEDISPVELIYDAVKEHIKKEEKNNLIFLISFKL